MSENKVAIVTGASRGIGKGISVSLAQVGYDLIINYYSNNTSALETKNQIDALGVRCQIAQADISMPEDRVKLIEFTKEKFGSCNLLVNNAGVAPSKRSDILEATEESFDRVMNINLKGPYFLTQLIANWMIEQKKEAAEDNFRIVNIGSISAYTSSPGRGEYCVSKAGMSMMTKLYADRLAEYGIGVYEIRPGVIETDMTSEVKAKYDKLIANGLTPIKRWGKPTDVGQAVAAIADGRLDFSTGQVIDVDGGFHLRRL